MQRFRTHVFALLSLAFLALFGACHIPAEGRRDYYAVRVVSGSSKEAQDYYAANGIPVTFDQWKAKYGFPQRQAGESLDRYRMRAGIVVYYNRDELGLGREVGCTGFTDNGSKGPQPGLACFVTNYGEQINDSQGTLADAIDGRNASGHDAYVYSPSSTRQPASVPGQNGASYGTQFSAYDRAGNLDPYSPLDAKGPRAVPQICTNCHGGTYDHADRLLIGGSFTPINPTILTFSSARGYTFEDQKSRIAALNEAMATPGSGCPPGFECIKH